MYYWALFSNIALMHESRPTDATADLTCSECYHLRCVCLNCNSVYTTKGLWKPSRYSAEQWPERSSFLITHVCIVGLFFFCMCSGEIVVHTKILVSAICRPQWPRGLRSGPAVARLLGLPVWMPPGSWMSLVMCYVRGLCDGPITGPEGSVRVWCVRVRSRNLSEEA